MVTSSDGQWIVSASDDHTLKVCDAANRKERCSFPVIGSKRAGELHRWKATAVCGDTGRNFYRLDLVGIIYGSIIINTQQNGQNFEFRCPACQKEHPIEKDRLGSVLTCLIPGCGLRLKINLLTIKMNRR